MEVEQKPGNFEYVFQKEAPLSCPTIDSEGRLWAVSDNGDVYHAEDD